MLLCTSVCKAWYNLIKDDSCWQAAFQIYFGIKIQRYNESLNQWELNHQEAIRCFSQSQRIDPTSWKKEYLIRVNLLRKWKKSKLGTITHNPSIGTISQTFFGPPEATDLSTVSLKHGVMIKSDAWTGKALEEKLECNPTNPLSQVDFLHIQPVCFSLRSDGNSVLWGMRNGELRISELERGLGGGGRTRRIGRDEDRHTSSITCLKFIKVLKPILGNPSGLNGLKIPCDDRYEDFLVSCSANGDLKIWSTDQDVSRCLGTIFLKTEESSNEVGSCISFNTSEDRMYEHVLAVGTTNGSVHYWTNLSFFDQLTTNLFLNPKNYKVIINRMEDGVLESVNYLAIDSWKTLKPSILVQRGLKNYVKRHWISDHKFSSDEGSNDDRFLKYGTDLDAVGSLTCVAQDFRDPTQHTPKPFSSPSKPVSHLRPTKRWNPNSKRRCDGSSRPSSELQSQYERSNRVIGGDNQGKTYIWSWRAEDAEALLASIKPPLLCLQDLGSLVTSISITPLLIAVGGEDGSTKVYDSLTGELLRVFRDKKTHKERSRLVDRNPSVEEMVEINDRFRVRSIGLGSDSIVIGVGELVMAWRIDRAKNIKPKKVDSRGNKVPGRVVSKRTGSSSFREIQDEVANTRERVRIESELKEKENRLMTRYHGEFSEWMNEEEVFEYMKMISMEESLVSGEQQLNGAEEEWERWEDVQESGGKKKLDGDGFVSEDHWSLLGIDGSGSGRSRIGHQGVGVEEWPEMPGCGSKVGSSSVSNGEVEKIGNGNGNGSGSGSGSGSPWKKNWIQPD